MQRISKCKLLIGEGEEERRFFQALLTHLNITNVDVEAYGGKSKLSSYLKTFLVRPDRQSVISLGITRDADDNADDAFRSICGALNQCGLAVPNGPGEFAGNAPQVGVLILPDGCNPGMLEDVCLEAIKSDPGMRCVGEYFHCIQDRTARQPQNMSKARVHAWLASQIEPDRRLGEAAEAAYWPWSDPAFDQLKQFLRGL